MKIKYQLLIGLSLALLFSGCASTTAVPALNQQKKVVWKSGNKYYYIPAYTFGGVVTKPWQYKNKVETSGFLECPVGYALVISMKEKKEFDKLNNDFRAILNAQETKIYGTHPIITPKTNSKEYKKMVEGLTAIYRRGSYACIKPMTNKEVKQYKAYQAQQAKINNDPRVIAARANQQASMMNYMAATAPRTVNYNVNHSGFVNYTGSVYHYGY